jgi:hypothetical protein
MTSHVSGQRLWAPRGTEIELDEDGLLGVAGSDKSSLSLAGLRATACLVLLGEPGLGKSTDMHTEAASLRLTLQEPDAVLEVDLGAFGDDGRLDEEVFNSDAWRAWADGEHCLHLFLDGLDEAQLRVGVAWRLLARRLASSDATRLRLRMACRTMSWQEVMEADLRKLWPSLRILKLLPLGGEDVADAVAADGLDADLFLAEARLRGVTALCSRPLTLRFLLRRFAADGTLPASQIEAFAEGCAILSAEPDRERRADLVRLEKRSGRERLVVASRIAALVLCSGRTSVWTDPDASDASVDDLLIREASGGIERDPEAVLEEQFLVDEAAVEAAMATAIFSGGDGGLRLRFAHRAIAEFLAGQWLASALAPKQSIVLLTEAVGATRRVYPQLREVAAWLASRSEAVLRELASADPGALLAADVRPPGGLAERLLVAGALAAIDQGEINPEDEAIARGLQRLDGAAAADDVLTAVSNASLQDRTRIAAISFAEARELRSLGPQLVEVALAEAESLSVRVAAACAARTLAGREDRDRLRELAPKESVPDDPAENLRGGALGCLWPDILTTTEVLERLIWAAGPDPEGAYALFAREHLVQGLDDDGLPLVLGWAAAQLREWPRQPPAEYTADALLVRAWPLRYRKDIDAGVTELVAARLRFGGPWISTDESERALAGGHTRIPPAERRELVRSLVPAVADRFLAWGNVTGSSPPLLDADDASWCTEQARGEQDKTLAEAWSMLATDLSHKQDAQDGRRPLKDSETADTRIERMSMAWDAFEEADPVAAYSSNPEGTISRLVELMTTDLVDHDLILSPALNALAELWDTRAEAEVARLLEERSVADNVFVGLLRLGLSYRSERIRAVALEDLAGASDEDEGSTTWNRSVDAAIGLLLYARSAWTEVWLEMLEHPTWAVEMFGIMTYHPGCERLGPDLEPEQVVELYTFLRQRCWQGEVADSFFPTWSKNLVENLIGRATRASVNAVRALRDGFSGDASLEDAARRAEGARLQRAWSPGTPRDILALTRDERARIVTAPADLLVVVHEALASLQDEITRPPPAAYDLWDTYARRPKAETEIADWVARGLRAALAGKSVVVNREVEIRRRTGAGIGERADIMIDAAAPDGLTIRVPIEVKGCWNRTLRTAMHEQLADRYLDEETTHGVYLVVWFSRNAWERTDSRRRACLTNRDLLLHELLASAGEIRARTGREIHPVVLDATLP